MHVQIVGYLQAADGRWEGTSTTTTLDRSTFGLQMLSTSEHGAVDTTEHDDVVGIMDGDAEGKNQPLNAYAVDTRSFPKHPSSLPLKG